MTTEEIVQALRAGTSTLVLPPVDAGLPSQGAGPYAFLQGVGIGGWYTVHPDRTVFTDGIRGEYLIQIDAFGDGDGDARALVAAARALIGANPRRGGTLKFTGDEALEGYDERLGVRRMSFNDTRYFTAGGGIT